MKEKNCEKTTRRSVYFLLSIVIFMWVVLFWTINVKASNNITIAGVDMGYSEGSYFSKNGSACKCHGRGTCGVAPDCNCIVVSGTSQCYGWSMWVENKLLGYNEISKASNFITVVTNYSNCTGSGIYNKLNGKIGVGTHIRTLSSKKGYSHSVSVISYDQNGIDITDCNHSGRCQVDVRRYTWDSFANFMNGYGGISFVKACKNGISVPDNPSVNNPFGSFDSITVDAGKIAVHGWAADMDTPDGAIWVHFYTIKDGVREWLGATLASDYRPDVSKNYPGLGEYHGFNAIFNTKVDGDIQIEAHGINVGSTGVNLMLSNSPKSALLPKDTIAPVISNVEITDRSETGYTITCTVTDNVEVSKVQFPTWTVNNGQDDIIWHAGEISENKVKCRINTSDHNNEVNCEYLTHIYAYDLEGNSVLSPVSVYVDTKGPIISDVEVTDISEKGYTVTCTVEDNTKISKVQFPTWTMNNGQDDIVWYEGKITGNKVSCRVNVSEHNNETNCEYYTHIYAWDEWGNAGECYKLQITVREQHKHEYISSIKKKATCSEKGIKLYTCTAGDDSYEEEIPATGVHVNTEIRNAKVATCTAEGYSGDTYCKECGTLIFTGFQISKKEHVWARIRVTQDPTCTMPGIKTYTCAECLGTKTEEIPATGKHENTEIRNAKESTCAEEGYTGDIYCKDCGTKVSTGQKLDKKEHTWDSGVVTIPPTCIERGEKTYTCTVCHATKIQIGREGANKNLHTWDTGTVTEIATCTKPGVKTYVCTLCGETKTEDIQASGDHKNTERKNVKEATCAETGYKGDLYCQDCGVLLEEGNVIPKSEHTWNAGEVTKSATCTDEGIKTYTCTGCGITKTEAISSTGHGLTEVRNKTEATCIESGYTGDIYCALCNQKISSGSIVEKTGHAWDSGNVTKQPTTAETGIKTYTCRNCGTTRKETIEKLKPENVTSGTAIKDKSSNGIYKVLNDGLSVEFTKSISKKATVKIPDTIKINGIACKVTGIAANAFKNNTSLRSVTIGKNVTVIGSKAFYGCKKLSKVSGGNSIMKFGDRAFANCESLGSITIPGITRSIGKQAFYNCKKLRNITIKTSALSSKNVGSKAFAGIYKKPTVKVPAKQMKAYKKLLTSKGMNSKAVYKK